MILFLNYLPYIIIALGIYLCFYFAKKHKGTDKVGKRIVQTILAVIVSWFLLMALTAGYIPKGGVPRAPVPDFTQDKTAENAPKIENRLLNTAKPKEQAQSDFDKMVDWRAKPEAAKPKAPDTATESQELPLPAKQ